MSFMSKFDIRDKRIMVTGGAQGIGKCVANILAECGAHVGIVDLNRDLAERTAESISREHQAKVYAYACDVANPQMVNDVFSSFVSDFGCLDGVFNNAGIVWHEEAETVSPEDWLKVINVNLNGVFYVAQAAAKQFIKERKRGSIVNTASMSGVIVNIPQCQASYNSSKAGVIQLTKSLAVEWAEKGIRVNCISPGYIYTEMTGSVREDWRQFWEGLIPFKRMGTPEELAGAVIYLLSDASTYTSGLNMIIDGAFTCI